MNRSHAKSYVNVALLLGALLAGAVTTRFVPEPPTRAAYVPPSPDQTLRPAVFKHAGSRDTSRDLSGVDVDMRRLNYFRNLC